MLKNTIAALALLATATTQAATYTETFESLSGLNTGNNNSGAIATQDPGSFDWSTSNPNNLQLVTLARASSSKNLSNITSQTAFGNWVGFLNGNNDVSFAAKAGAGFTTFNFDSASFYADNAGTLTITGLLANGSTVTQTLSLLATKRTDFIDSGKFDGVTEITFSGKRVAFDNVVTTTTVSAVPEPGSYAMLLAGLAMMGCIVRRRSV